MTDDLEAEYGKYAPMAREIRRLHAEWVALPPEVKATSSTAYESLLKAELAVESLRIRKNQDQVKEEAAAEWRDAPPSPMWTAISIAVGFLFGIVVSFGFGYCR